MQFLPFFIHFSYSFYLGHLSLLGLKTKTRRQRNSSTFSSCKSYNPETFMSSAASDFVHATRKRSQKVPRAKSGTFWFPWMDSHDSAPFNSSCVAHNIRLERSFSIERFQSYTASKIRKFQYNRVVFSISSRRFIESAQEQIVKDKKKSIPCVLPSF